MLLFFKERKNNNSFIISKRLKRRNCCIEQSEGVNSKLFQAKQAKSKLLILSL